MYLSAAGPLEKVIEVYALIELYVTTTNAVFFKEAAMAGVNNDAELPPPGTISSAKERGRGGVPFQMAAELLGHLPSWTPED